jgi:hypothetical protein
LQRIETVRRWISLSLSQHVGWTDFNEILGVNCLKKGLSIFTTFDPCLLFLFLSERLKEEL